MTGAREGEVSGGGGDGEISKEIVEALFREWRKEVDERRWRNVRLIVSRFLITS
jgi:hypothetical protein